MRFLTIFFQCIWILIWPAIGAIVTYTTGGDNNYYYIAIISIIGFIDLAWFIMSSASEDHLDVFFTIGNLMILDIPAYIFAKKFFEKKKQKEASANKMKIVYKKDKEETFKEEVADDDILLTDWEKEQLKKKHPKKYEKEVKKEQAVNVVDYEVETTRKIIRGFSVYLISLVYKKDPKIVNTYNIITQFKDMVKDDATRNKLIDEFSSLKDINKLIQDYDAKVMTAKRINDSLKQTDPEEFNVALKQDRVDIQIDAKDYLASKKKPVKKIGTKKTSNKKTTK